MLFKRLLSLSILFLILIAPTGWSAAQDTDEPTYGFESMPPYAFYRFNCDQYNSNGRVRQVIRWINAMVRTQSSDGHYAIDPNPAVVGYVPCGLNVTTYGVLVDYRTHQVWACLAGWEYMGIPAGVHTCSEAVLIRDRKHEYGVLTANNLGVTNSGEKYTKTIYPADLERLAWLVDVEGRGMGTSYWTAGLSVLSTVFYRMESGELSDGTIKGTLGRCTPDGSLCQFPAWIVDLGCHGVIDDVCPFGHGDDLMMARQVVSMYLDGYRGLCDGYLYYDAIPGGRQDCAIQAPDGSVEQFFTR